MRLDEQRALHIQRGTLPAPLLPPPVFAPCKDPARGVRACLTLACPPEPDACGLQYSALPPLGLQFKAHVTDWDCVPQGKPIEAPRTHIDVDKPSAPDRSTKIAHNLPISIYVPSPVASKGKILRPAIDVGGRGAPEKHTTPSRTPIHLSVPVASKGNIPINPPRPAIDVGGRGRDVPEKTGHMLHNLPSRISVHLPPLPQLLS